MLTCEDMVSRTALTTGKTNLEAVGMAMAAYIKRSHCLCAKHCSCAYEHY
jgi:hypothetical protein